MKETASYAELSKVWKYDPETGDLIRLIGGSRAGPGTVVATLNSEGYYVTRWNGKQYKAHRVCWLLFHGSWPKQDVDHRDHNKINNRIENLRECSRSGNNSNRPKLRTAKHSRFKGVSLINGRWIARIHPGYGAKRIELGRFNTEEKARDAYNAAAERYHREYACTEPKPVRAPMMSVQQERAMKRELTRTVRSVT